MNIIAVHPDRNSVVSIAPNKWLVEQIPLGPQHDTNQCVTWLRIDNRGSARQIQIHLRFINGDWPQHRFAGYLKTRGIFRVLRGIPNGRSTVYTLRIPRGISYFGPTPWYSLRDAGRFLAQTAKNAACTRQSLGVSGQGRDIEALIIDRTRGRSKGNVIVIAREHANESSGSFAVEAVARYLLGGDAPKDWLKHYVFHLVPVINPDGVSAGTKITRPGSVNEVDLWRQKMDSNEPTFAVLRAAVMKLRPVCALTYHAYSRPEPACMFYNKRDGVAMLEYLLSKDNWIGLLGPVTWQGPDHVKSVWHVNRMPGGDDLWSHCVFEFGSVFNMPELPWHGRTVDEMESIGRDSFIAAMKALEARGRA